ncbi:4110_t:CDS:10, partial [Paraglomus occultum]
MPKPNLEKKKHKAVFCFAPYCFLIDDAERIASAELSPKLKENYVVGTINTDNLLFGAGIPIFGKINGFTYPNGTGLMQLFRSQTPPLVENNLYIRLLYPNGTLNKFTVPTYDVHNVLPRAYPLNDGYVLVTHLKDDIVLHGMLVDWSGQVLQRYVMLADGPLNATDSNDYKTLVKTNIDPDKDFLVTAMDPGKFIQWKIFSAPNNSMHQITQLYFGSITGHNGNLLTGFSIFPTTEGGYGIAVLENIMHQVEDITLYHSSPLWFLYVNFWQPDTRQFDTPHLVWQSSNPSTYNFYNLDECEVAADGTGYFCIIEYTSFQSVYEKTNTDYVKVEFLSSGSVTDVNVILTGAENNAEKNMYGIRRLPYGGFLVIQLIQDQEDYTITYNITVAAHNGTIVKTFLFDQYIDDFAIFPNNTLWMGAVNSSQLIVYNTPLPKQLPEDAGFNNLLVKSSSPQSGTYVSSSTTDITLIFRDQVALSTQNISVYQATDGNPILRQGFNAKSSFCSVTLNDSAVTCKIFKSTFNTPDATYDVVVDNNFVMSKSLKQPLPGVAKGKWVYYGDSAEAKGEYTETTTGLLRLTPEGTTYFEQLSTNDKNSFLDSMVTKLAELIPIDPSRITTSRRNQPDPNAQNQITFQITLKPTEDQSQKTVQQIMDDLDDLIKYKAYNSFSQENFTKYLDETYGFSPVANLWATYRFKLIGLFAGLLILSIIYLFARQKYPEGQNFAAVKLVLILADLSLDIAFVLSSARNVPQLHTPSIAFLIVPIVFNSTLAFSILMTELSKNTKFQEWFSQNVRIASILTLLAGADVEAITFLGSKFAGWQMFSAPLSKTALNYIFWGSTLNLFIEDIPQLVIQILYRHRTVSYDIIPLLSLIMSSIILTSNIIGHLYDGYIKLKEKKLNHYIKAKDE